jgi:outer membrane protein OmpA-like peptidoglycan-associated protein
MKLLIKVVLFMVIVLSFMGLSYAKQPLGVNYLDYTYKDEGSIVVYPADSLFVISDYKDIELKPYVKLKEDTIKKPVISLKVEEKMPVDVVSNSKEQQHQETQYVIYFDFDSYKIRKSELEKIKNIPITESTIANIYGYTCKIGSSQYNLKLSKKRATQVAKALQSRGIPVGEVKGMGITRENKILKLNRKAVIKITQ